MVRVPDVGSDAAYPRVTTAPHRRLETGDPKATIKIIKERENLEAVGGMRNPGTAVAKVPGLRTTALKNPYDARGSRGRRGSERFTS